MSEELDYKAADTRYDGRMPYIRCGRSGVKLPAVSLGFWHNFGSADDFDKAHATARCAFDNGITCFDLANNYGPEYGTAEENLGRMMDLSFRPYRDELFITTKAGYDMWPGPYGEWGSRKYLMSSLDQSLKRMRLDYVDLFYSHRYDPETPLEETMQALVDIVRQGKALYVGISNYPVETLDSCFSYLRERDVFQDGPQPFPQKRGADHGYGIQTPAPERYGRCALSDTLRDGAGMAAQGFCGDIGPGGSKFS